MARKKKEIIITSTSGKITQKSALTLCDYIQRY